VKDTDDRHRRLLRTRRDWPSGPAAEKRDELAPPDHSITSSVRASSMGGGTAPQAQSSAASR
jgi:hypothetical protein